MSVTKTSRTRNSSTSCCRWASRLCGARNTKPSSPCPYVGGGVGDLSADCARSLTGRDLFAIIEEGVCLGVRGKRPSTVLCRTV